eukprot:11438641-Prorocentrum_lima.AAC.1
MSLAYTKASTKTTCHMFGAVSNAKETVVKLRVSTCTFSKNPGAILVEEPEVFRCLLQVIKMA